MAQTKKRLPRFEAEGAVIWEAGSYNKHGYKSVIVKTDPPKFLDKKFSKDEVEIIKKAFEPQEGYEDPAAFMAIHEKWTKGNDQEVLHQDCYLEYTIRIAPGKGNNSDKKYVNMLIKKIEVLQKEEEENAA